MSESSYWTRRAGLSRRRFLAGSAVLGAAVAGGTLVACGDDDNAPSSGGGGSPAAGGTKPSGSGSPISGEQPKSGGTYRLAARGPTGIQDPNFASVPTYVDAWFGDPFFQLSNKTREFKAGVIEKWEQPDQNTLILKLRQGVKFFNMAPANGRAMEAKDVVYTMRSMTGSAFPDAKIPFPRKGLFTNVKEPTIVDPSTVKLETTSPRSDLLLSLAEYRNAVVPEGLREAFGGYDSLFTPDPKKLVGTGPFIAKELDGNGGNSVWERNPDYWNKPYPYIDKIQHTAVADGPAQLTALITGQNYQQTFVTQQEIDTIKRGLPNVQLPTFPLNGFYHIGLNTRKKELADPRVRMALAIMFDKPGFSSAIVGKDLWKYSGPLPWGYNESLSQDDLSKVQGMRSPTAQDITDAKALLNAAGVTNLSVGHTSPVDVQGISAFKQVGEHWKEQVEKNLPGVKINIDASTYTNMLAAVGKPDGWDSYSAGWSQETTPIQMLQVSYLTKGGRNFTGYGSDAFDKLVDQALQEFDDKKRTDLLQQAQRIMLKDLPLFTTHQGVTTIALRPEVQGLDIGGVGFIDHWVRYAWLKT